MTKIAGDAGYQAYRILQIVFILAPIIAGLDKFFDLLVDWHRYLAPAIAQTVPIDRKVIMMIVGVIEIIAGIGVWWRPQIFAYIVALWLLLIIINFFILGGYFDIALRDFGLMLSALALGRLSHKYATRVRT